MLQYSLWGELLYENRLVEPATSTSPRDKKTARHQPGGQTTKSTAKQTAIFCLILLVGAQPLTDEVWRDESQWLVTSGQLCKEQISDRAAQHGAVYLNSLPLIPDGVCPVSVETIWGSLVFFWGFFFGFFCASQQLFTEFPIRPCAVNLEMKHLKRREIYMNLQLSTKKSKLTSKVKWLISWKHCSACLIEALFSISLCTWGIDWAFPRVHCEAQLQADKTLRVYMCFFPSCLTFFVINPSDCSSVVQVFES